VRILQVSTVDTAGGGAEKVAWDLHQAYRSRGHESYLVVGSKRSDDPYTFEIGAARAKQHPLHLLLSGEELGLQGFRHPRSHRISELVTGGWDVAHVHNLHGRYFDLAALPELVAAAPTILSLHDMWLLTGHCAHPFGCQRWRSGCGDCPDLSIDPPARFDFTARNLARKQRFIPQPGVVLASAGRWLLDLIAESYLSELPRLFMPNPVDTSIFRPGDRRAARDSLGLPQDLRIMLFPAELRKSPNPFKAQHMFTDAARALGGGSVVGVAFGDGSASIEGLRILPSTSDPRTIADRYRAADIVVLPSRADTAPLAIPEAMACGIPVIATRVGGIPEMVEEGVTGDLVAVDDTDALVEACRRLLDEPARSASYGAAALKAVRPYALEVVASSWVDTYSRLVGQRGNDTNPSR